MDIHFNIRGGGGCDVIDQLEFSEFVIQACGLKIS